MSDIVIKNKSSESDTMVLFRMGLYIAGDKNAIPETMSVRKRVNEKGQVMYLVEDVTKSDVKWKDAAEGLAKYIEEHGN